MYIPQFVLVVYYQWMKKTSRWNFFVPLVGNDIAKDILQMKLWIDNSKLS